MRVLIDLMRIRRPVYMGLTNASIDIVKGFVKYTDWEIILLVRTDLKSFIDDSIGVSLPKLEIPSSMCRKSRLMRRSCPLFVKAQMEQIKIDIVLSPVVISSFFFPRKYHQIGVVHDLQYAKGLFYSHKWTAFLGLLTQLIIGLHLTPTVVSISNSVGKDLWKYCKRKSVTIYNSVEPTSDYECEIEGIVNRPYVLDVNSFLKYKNTERLISAFCSIKDKIPHTLYLKGNCSQKDRYEELKKLTIEKGCEDRVIIDGTNRSNEEMNYLYSHASLFVSPSLMEGFGLTPIEAALHKIPVIVSNIETLVEVTEGLVATFDPKSEKSIAKAIMNAINNPPTKDELNFISNHYSKKYSPQKQIRQYVDLIESIIYSQKGKDNYHYDS